MSMTQGNVSIADDGTPTKSGAAGAVYDALVARFAARSIPGLGSDGKPNATSGADVLASPAGVAIKRGMADQAVGIAALVPYITVNGVVTTTISHNSPAGAGLQFVPAAVTGGIAVPCDPPDVDRTVTGAIT